MASDKENGNMDSQESISPPQKASASMSNERGSASPNSAQRRNGSYESAKHDRRSRSRSPRRHHRRHRSRRSRSRSYERRTYRRYNDGRENPEPSKILGVFGMSHRTTSRDLDEIFGKYGKIDDIKIIKDHATGDSRGFGFIYFANLEDAKDAREELNGREIDGRNIRTDFSISKTGHPSNRGRRESSRYGDRHDRSNRRSRYYNRSRSRDRHRRD